MKQDRNGVRTAQDLERKYNLSSLVDIQKNVKLSVEGINKVENELTNFANATTKHFIDVENEIEENVSYNVSINSSNGTVFKNGNITTILSAVVRKGNNDITDLFTDTQFYWTRVSEDTEGDIAWNNAHKNTKTVTVTDDDVNVRATFNVFLDLEEV